MCVQNVELKCYELKLKYGVTFSLASLDNCVNSWTIYNKLINYKMIYCNAALSIPWLQRPLQVKNDCAASSLNLLLRLDWMSSPSWFLSHMILKQVQFTGSLTFKPNKVNVTDLGCLCNRIKAPRSISKSTHAYLLSEQNLILKPSWTSFHRLEY